MKKFFFLKIWWYRLMLWLHPQEKIDFDDLFLVALQETWLKNWLQTIEKNKKIKNELIYDKEIELKKKILEFDNLIGQFDLKEIKKKKNKKIELDDLINLGKITLNNKIIKFGKLIKLIELRKIILQNQYKKTLKNENIEIDTLIKEFELEKIQIKNEIMKIYNSIKKIQIKTGIYEFYLLNILNINKLKELNELKELKKLNELKKLDELEKLDKLNILNKSKKITEIKKLYKLYNIKDINDINEINELEINDLHNINIRNDIDLSLTSYLRLFQYRETKKICFFYNYKLYCKFLRYKLYLICIYTKIHLNPKEGIFEYDTRKISWKDYDYGNLKEKYLQKGYKYKNLGIYLKNLINNNNDLYFQNLKNVYNSYCHLLIRLNRKNLFLTLLNNEGNVLCKTNIGASGFKKKVKRTGYAIKGTGKNFIKKIKRSLIKSIFILYKKNIKNLDYNSDYNFQNKVKNLKFIKRNNFNINNITKRKKIKKINRSLIKLKKNKINILKKNSKKIIRSKLLWIKIWNNLKRYRIYYYPNLNNLIKKNLRIIFRIKTSLKLWAFRFVVYGLFKKLPWFRGIEFRLPITHSNSLRLKKKRRV